jgi:hypothetical protein
MNPERKIGELTIKMQTLERGTTKPLIHNIEILYPNKYKTEKRFVGIIDTGSDITRIDEDLLRTINLEEIKKDIFELNIRIPELFGDRRLYYETQPFKITKFNKADIKPDILLGRDFLSSCKLYYNGLNNTILIESYEIE